MTASQSERANAFRALHQRAGAFVMPNPWDVGTARILAGLGFAALATTSAGLAFTLGRRDAEGGVTRDEALAHARIIVDATPLPVSADLENGFGAAPETVAETIRLAAAAGLVGGSIEDVSGDPERPNYDLVQAVERVGAAAEAARAAVHVHPDRARKISSTAGPTSTTPSGGCKPSRRRAPTCSTRRACATWQRSGPCAGRSVSR
jgi:2-methylisocitrate lyase-like PEP mutase family enzyme